MNLLRIISLFFVTLITHIQLFSQNPGQWTWMSGLNTTNSLGAYGTQGIPNINNYPPALYESCQWIDLNGNFWLFGGNQIITEYSDLWKYNPVTSQWTWVKGPGISNQPGVYGTMGVPSIANMPGCRAWTSMTWTDASGDLWLFGGNGTDGIGGYGGLADLWRYNIASNTWTWMKGSNAANQAGVYGTMGVSAPSNYPENRIEASCTWTENNNLWLFGGQYISALGGGGFINSLWKYNTLNNQWTWMNGNSTYNQLSVYGTKGVPNSANNPGGRSVWARWKDCNNNLWLFGGTALLSVSGVLTQFVYNDVWKYDIVANNWTWVGGTNVSNNAGTAGTKCVLSPNNIPASRWESRACWSDSTGNFWLFGGGTNPGSYSETNDLWFYNITTNQWALVGGSAVPNQAGSYGAKTVSTATNAPPSRMGSVSWRDLQGNLWFEGGYDPNASSSLDKYYNDVWRFVPDTTCPIIPKFHIDLGKDTTLCFPNTIILDAKNPGSTYQWSTGNTTKTITVNTNGNYAVTVTNPFCQTDSDTINISYISNSSINLGKDTILCVGSSLTLDAKNPGSTYKWSTGATSQTIIVTTSGSYRVTVTNPPCSGADTINVTFNPQPIVDLGNDTTICTGNPILLDAKNAGSSYKWSTGATSQTINVVTAGTYAVTVSTGSCTDRDTINISLGVVPLVYLGKDTTLCAGNALTLDADNPGKTFKWSTGATSQTISVNSTGSYDVTVSDNGCSERDTILVTFIPSPVVDLGNDTLICTSASYNLDAGNPGYTYSWSTGATSQNILVSTSGAYSVSVFNGLCSDRDTINITLGVLPFVDLGNDTVLCDGMNLTLDAGNQGSTFQWSTGAVTQIIAVTSKGTYAVTVSNNGCTASDEIIINFVSPPIVNLGQDTALCGASSYVLNAGNPGCTYQWSTGSATQAITVTTAGTYSVSVSCAVCPPASDEINVAFTNQFSSLYFPNTFTPDKNGLNDVFKASGEGITNYNLKIYTRWGELIFETTDYNTGWDGKYKNRLVQFDTYVWVVDYSFICAPKKNIRKYGNVLLLK